MLSCFYQHLTCCVIVPTLALHINTQVYFISAYWIFIQFIFCPGLMLKKKDSGWNIMKAHRLSSHQHFFTVWLTVFEQSTISKRKILNIKPQITSHPLTEFSSLNDLMKDTLQSHFSLMCSLTQQRPRGHVVSGKPHQTNVSVFRGNAGTDWTRRHWTLLPWNSRWWLCRLPWHTPITQHTAVIVARVVKRCKTTLTSF